MDNVLIGREDLYITFKICLLLKNMTIKEFADRFTGTSPQHVTMVAKGEKDSAPVIHEIAEFIDSTLDKNNNQSFLKRMLKHGESVKNGGSIERGIESGETGEKSYEW